MTREREVALEAVRSAARLCRSVRESFSESLATHKADRSPVTVADLGAQVLISLAIGEAFPADPVMGEEDASQLRDGAPAAIRTALGEQLARVRPGIDAETAERALARCGDTGGPRGRWWTLDPVDGTKGFLRGGQYAVALALVEDGEVVLGVLGCPNLERADGRVGSLFVAERGGGAWELPLDADEPPTAISVAAITDRVGGPLRGIARGGAFRPGRGRPDRRPAGHHDAAAAAGQPGQVRAGRPWRRIDLPAHPARRLRRERLGPRRGRHRGDGGGRGRAAMSTGGRSTSQRDDG